MFTPTFLYIKRHIDTGILYFGKTTKDPIKYKGSGILWKRILSKYGNNVETLWFCLFLDQDSCTEFALMFSKQENIAKSDLWANLIEENGLDGAPVGHPSFISDPVDVASKISIASLRNWSNTDYREKMIESQKNSWTEDRRKQNGENMKKQWTPERRSLHGSKLKGKKMSTPSRKKGVPHSSEHASKISIALKGKEKSAQHKENLRNSKIRVCRLFDRKEITLFQFLKWIKDHVSDNIDSILP